MKLSLHSVYAAKAEVDTAVVTNGGRIHTWITLTVESDDGRYEIILHAKKDADARLMRIADAINGASTAPVRAAAALARELAQ